MSLWTTLLRTSADLLPPYVVQNVFALCSRQALAECKEPCVSFTLFVNF